ncbi:MAG: hypothetical protein ACK478_01685 [Flavobacteriales bacterium]|jgi:hypothetical protein
MKEDDPHDQAAMSSKMRSVLERSKDSLQVPEGYFETQAALLESKLQESFETPESFFDQQAGVLEQLCMHEMDAMRFGSATNTRIKDAKGLVESDASIAFESKRGRVIRLWLTAAAAAALLGVIISVVPSNEESRSASAFEGTSFAVALGQSQLEYDDLNELELDETLYEELVVLDTLQPDTVSMKNLPKSVEEFKPAAGQRIITWDDITEEDIQEYLKEEQSLNIIDEL